MITAGMVNQNPKVEPPTVTGCESRVGGSETLPVGANAEGVLLVEDRGVADAIPLPSPIADPYAA